MGGEGEKVGMYVQQRPRLARGRDAVYAGDEVKRGEGQWRAGLQHKARGRIPQRALPCPAPHTPIPLSSRCAEGTNWTWHYMHSLESMNVNYTEWRVMLPLVVTLCNAHLAASLEWQAPRRRDQHLQRLYLTMPSSGAGQAARRAKGGQGSCRRRLVHRPQQHALRWWLVNWSRGVV